MTVDSYANRYQNYANPFLPLEETAWLNYLYISGCIIFYFYLIFWYFVFDTSSYLWIKYGSSLYFFLYNSFITSFSLPSYLPLFLPSFLSSFPPCFLHSLFHSNLPFFLPSFHFPSHPSFLLYFLHSYVDSFLLSFLPSFLPCFFPFFLSSSLPCFLLFFITLVIFQYCFPMHLYFFIFSSLKFGIRWYPAVWVLENWSVTFVRVNTLPHIRQLLIALL